MRMKHTDYRMPTIDFRRDERNDDTIWREEKERTINNFLWRVGRCAEKVRGSR